MSDLVTQSGLADLKHWAITCNQTPVVLTPDPQMSKTVLYHMALNALILDTKQSHRVHVLEVMSAAGMDVELYELSRVADDGCATGIPWQVIVRWLPWHMILAFARAALL